MRKKIPDGTSWKKKGLSIFVIGEGILFIGAYYVYHQMNTRRDYRYEMLMKHKWALDLYYYIGEKGGYKTREEDYEVWGIKDTQAKAS